MVIEPDCIDLFGLRKDGGADLLIAPNAPLDDLPETYQALLDKVQLYLGYINSSDFHAQYPRATPANTRIILHLKAAPSPQLTALAEKIVPWTAEYGAVFQMKIL